MKSDEVYKKTKRQIQKDYNDALEEALRKNREYFKTVEKVQNGKIKPPSELKIERQIEAWLMLRWLIYMGTSSEVPIFFISFDFYKKK